MSTKIPPGAVAPLFHTPPEMSYPDLSPQLLARVKQLWSARGLDFDSHWRAGIRTLSGFRAVPRLDAATDSATVDLVFLFDQALLWVRALQAAAAEGHAAGLEGMSAAQWHGLAGVTARLSEQMTALRLLALTELPLPAMQIARSLSEDVDMALVLLIRPKLAQRFSECRTAEDTNEFWRRHIAGGRAFRAISEKLYSAGIDHSADTEYAKWRKSVLAVLSTAVHSNLLHAPSPEPRQGKTLLNDDSLYFATFRIHELCAYAQLVMPELTGLLRQTGARAPGTPGTFAPLAAPLSAILIDQIQSLTAPASEARAQEQARRH
ncbi:hypothetical protein [Celeribacter neptunius]|uniref:Uncharacterized protein n=1 Tax=Celeribacter neptunius TaxID=588602 RepID=A0A1I3VKV1_9RHOB|nr:hypothetical protein [Celeribacter neptunius]SFJ96044.1 hypothetical protein SAMN04487991_3427 [Celeribacter neptunius]